MAGLASSVYNTIIRSNTVFLGTIFAGAFAFQLAFDSTTDKMWDSINKGRQWKDIKQRYMQAQKDDEDEDE